jgi:uncharacterized protein YegP (UPF0339 family)
MIGQFIIVKRHEDPHEWWWTLKSATNGKTLAHSETYRTRRARNKTAHELAAKLGARIVDRDRKL